MGERVLIVPLDGKLPNLALMRLSAFERSIGSEVVWRHQAPARDLFTQEFDRVYGSAIFDTSGKAVERLRSTYPHAIIGGSGGYSLGPGGKAITVEDLVPASFSGLDYSAYLYFTASIGYAMRGCRFDCRAHCMVPEAEGKPRSVAAIGEIWRGPGYPKHLHLLDNDFFGNPQWRVRVREIVDGKFKVCLNQGVTARVMNDEQAKAVVEMHPWDDQFQRARLYVAWDQYDDERVFMRGIDCLERAGWKPEWVFSYMLVGCDPKETWERIWHRFNRMVERGIRPYPMVFNKLRESDPELWRQLKRFQRWVIRGVYKVAPFDEYDPSFKGHPQP